MIVYYRKHPIQKAAITFHQIETDFLWWQCGHKNSSGVVKNLLGTMCGWIHRLHSCSSWEEKGSLAQPLGPRFRETPQPDALAKKDRKETEKRWHVQPMKLVMSESVREKIKGAVDTVCNLSLGCWNVLKVSASFQRAGVPVSKWI